ncbi:dihydropteroate synthase [Actinomyces minihominis]|uniref:dihydropteroate synthase n=1 Tax=Actinomyces minihominis TaxID=2002838 RepID=UPI000C079420|nr:dihydropteroate synthase [Actinomyces minihominis]
MFTTTKPPVPAPLLRGVPLGGGKTSVMGVLNVTPDSFSDGGLWLDPLMAVDHGLRMMDEGAIIIDVGGESTRPGARRVSVEEEWERVGPVVAALARRDITTSIDTVNSEVARRAIEEGADLINDVSGGVHDPQMTRVAAEAGLPMVIQHWRGFPSQKDLNQDYIEVVGDVLEEVEGQLRLALENGLRQSQMIIDPGLGFAKKPEDSWGVVYSLSSLTARGLPVLVGASRKRFVVSRYPDDVEGGTLEVTKRCVEAGVWAVRVHHVAGHVRLIDELS